MFEATLKGTSDMLFVVRKRGNANHPTTVSRTYKKINKSCKVKWKKRTLHERKIMLTFFSRLKPHAFFEYHAYFETSVISVCAYGGNGVTGGLSCLSWTNFGSTLGLFAQVWFKRVPQAKNGALLQPFTLWSPKHAHAAVLDCADNALLRARPSQQLLYLFRHTWLHRADEWVKIGGRHILIPIISVWFGGVIGIIGLGRPSGLHMFPFSPRLLCWSALHWSH